MNKLIVSVVLLFLGFTMISSFCEGGGGIVSTDLTAGVSNAVTTIPVTSTTGFLTADVVVIGDEKVAYTGTTPVTFTGCTRGYNDTEAVVHSAGDKVYSEEVSVLNAALGFNIASTASTAGIAAVVQIPWKFLTISMPRLVMFDYSFFTGQLKYVQVVFQVIGVGFAVTMAVWMINALMGIFRP